MTALPEKRPKPLVLVILDGWGHREPESDNAITAAQTPVLDQVTHDYPCGFINASELHVGLPAGQMGNSEVGHMNIGSGRVLMQDLPRIDAAIATGAIQKILALTAAIEQMKQAGKLCHLLCLVSDGGVHSHMGHLVAMAKLLAAQGIGVRIHAILDGRDTPPQSALAYLEFVQKEIQSLPNVSIATVSGRYYAMDRDKRWDRVQKAYDVIVGGTANNVGSALDVVKHSYDAGITDEFILPVAIGDYKGMHDGEGIMMVNFRSDRVREILTALLDPQFNEFPRQKTILFCAALGMTEYSSKLKPFIPALFPPEPLTQIFG